MNLTTTDSKVHSRIISKLRITTPFHRTAKKWILRHISGASLMLKKIMIKYLNLFHSAYKTTGVCTRNMTEAHSLLDGLVWVVFTNIWQYSVPQTYECNTVSLASPCCFLTSILSNTYTSGLLLLTLQKLNSDRGHIGAKRICILYTMFHIAKVLYPNCFTVFVGEISSNI